MAGELTPLYIDGACASAVAARYLQGQMICEQGVGGDWYEPGDSFRISVDPHNAQRIIAKRGVAFVAEHRDSQIPAYYFVASDEDVTGTYAGQTAGDRDIYLIIQDSNEQGTVNGWTLAFFPTDWANPTNIPALRLAIVYGNGQTLEPTSVRDVRQSFHTCTTGAPNELTIGETRTLPPGSQATAEITGAPPHQQLSLGLPQGLVGPQGPQGPLGPAGPPGTTSAGYWQLLQGLGREIFGTTDVPTQSSYDNFMKAKEGNRTVKMLPSVDFYADTDIFRLIAYSPACPGVPERYAGLAPDASPGYRVQYPWSGSGTPSAIDMVFTGMDAKQMRGSNTSASALQVAAIYGTSLGLGTTALGIWFTSDTTLIGPLFMLNAYGSMGLSDTRPMFPVGTAAEALTPSSPPITWTPDQGWTNNSDGTKPQMGGRLGEIIVSHATPPYWTSLSMYPSIPPPRLFVSMISTTARGSFYMHEPFGSTAKHVGDSRGVPLQVRLFPDKAYAKQQNLRARMPAMIGMSGEITDYAYEGEYTPLPPQIGLYRWISYAGE